MYGLEQNGTEEKESIIARRMYLLYNIEFTSAITTSQTASIKHRFSLRGIQNVPYAVKIYLDILHLLRNRHTNKRKSKNHTHNTKPPS